MKKHSGFTLIELVIVIIILGILSATAIPKFINLQDDAKTSVLEGVKGSLSSAATLAYSKLAISGLEGKAMVNDDDGDSSKMFTDCKTCVFRYGYPVGVSTTLRHFVDGISYSDDFNFYDDGKVTGGYSVKVTFSKDIESGKNVNGTQCYVQYTSYDAKGKPPLVDVVKCS